MIWASAEFKIVVQYGDTWRIEPRAGYAYRGLGLHMIAKPSPKGRRPPKWSVTHLGSGHSICTLKGAVKEAFPIATEIAEAGDWEFDGLSGWKNRFPNAYEKLCEILEKHKKRADIASQNIQSSEDAARTVAMERA